MWIAEFLIKGMGIKLKLLHQMACQDLFTLMTKSDWSEHVQ